MSFLERALKSVDWNKNCSDFINDENRSDRLLKGIKRVALWSSELQAVNVKNPALPFIREMHASAISVSAAIALGLHKAGAGNMCAIVESALYFSYFKDHHAELSTLVRDEKYYISRKFIIDYHKEHTIEFIKRQECFGFLSKLDRWYSNISAIVHGQIPGVWSSSDIGGTIYSAERVEASVSEFEEATDLMHMIFLITCSGAQWDGISPASKAKFTKGLSGDQKAILGISKK